MSLLHAMPCDPHSPPARICIDVTYILCGDCQHSQNGILYMHFLSALYSPQCTVIYSSCSVKELLINLCNKLLLIIIITTLTTLSRHFVISHSQEISQVIYLISITCSSDLQATKKLSDQGC